MNRLTPLRRSGKTETVVRVLVLVAIAVLLATSPLHDWPVNVTLSADSDTTVVVTWYSQEQKGGGFCEEPPPDPYDSFELFFQPVGETSWTAVGRTRDTFMHHDPQYRVGNYSVRGWRRDEVNWHPGYDDNLASTVPRHIGPVRLHEASTGDTSVLGLEYYYLFGYVQAMDTSTFDTYADVYLTDYKAGTSGPLLLMSTSLVPDDPGVHVTSRPRSWHTTWFSAPLSEDQSLLPRWDPFGWGQVCSLLQAPLVVACRRYSGDYARIRVLSLDSTSVELEAWYQQVHGLRLAGAMPPDTVAK
jgi:hypothetical protein